MKSQLQELNEKGVFKAEPALLELRLKVWLLLRVSNSELNFISKKLKKITHRFAMSPHLIKGFYVGNDSISVAILNSLSDEMLESIKNSEVISHEQA